MDTALLYSDDYCKTFKPLLHSWAEGGFFTLLSRNGKNDLWFGNYVNECVYSIEPNSLIIKKYSLDTLHTYTQHFLTYDFCRLNDSILMVGTLYGETIKFGGGLFFLNIKTGKYWNYYSEDDNPYSLSNNNVWCIIKDKQNNIWAGTDDGLNSFNFRELNFHWSFCSNWGLPGLNALNITAMRADRCGNLWLGTTHGLIEHRLLDHNFSWYHFPSPQTDPERRNNLFSVFPSGDSIYVGGGPGYMIFNAVSHVFEPDRKLQVGLEGLYYNTARSITKDKDGNYWFGTYSGGLYTCNPATGKGKNYFEHDTVFLSHYRNYINQVAIDTAGNKWIGTFEDGFYRIEAKTGKVVWNTPEDTKSQVADRGRIEDIYCDKKGNIYIATQMDGLITYNDATGKFRIIKNNKWPEDNKIKIIIPGNDGTLWLVTGKGLSNWDIENNKFYYYSEGSGFASMQDIAGCFSPLDSNIYIGGGSNLFYFNPKEINKASPEIYPAIVSVDIMNKEYLKDITKPISISYHDNFISFTFSAFDFLNEKQDQFAYYLEGFDKDWNYCGNRHYASYTNLPGGDYDLKLKVQNTEGRWVETNRPIHLHITTPYYRTWWFFLLCGLAIFGLGYLFYYLQIQRKTGSRKITDKIGQGFAR